ncbi:MAG: thioredoxin domain-containing protein [Rhizomicrobium sp.]|jgi:protein-disulfide isomerase
MNGKQIIFGIVGLAAVALVVAAVYVIRGGQGQNDTAVDVPKYTIQLSPADHIIGSTSAPVQVVEYAAPVCPICARWDMTIFPAFKKQYIDTGKAYYVFRVYPLRPVDVAVEAMARCLPKSAYFQFIDMMYRNQPKWDPDGYQIPDQQAALVDMGKVAGMTPEQVDSCTANEPELKKIAAVGEFASKTYNIDSTPSFIIDGVFHQQDMMASDSLSQVLDAEMKKKQS